MDSTRYVTITSFMPYAICHSLLEPLSFRLNDWTFPSSYAHFLVDRMSGVKKNDCFKKSSATIYSSGREVHLQGLSWKYAVRM